MSTVVVVPEASDCDTENSVAILPSGSSTRWRMVAARAREDALTSVVFTCTVAPFADTLGVVTNVPHQSTCSGSVTTR